MSVWHTQSVLKSPGPCTRLCLPSPLTSLSRPVPVQGLGLVLDAQRRRDLTAPRTLTATLGDRTGS